jgi:hypothetical protein
MCSTSTEFAPIGHSREERLQSLAVVAPVRQQRPDEGISVAWPFAQARPGGYRGWPAVESEASYLRRHRLLTTSERSTLARSAFELEDIPFDTGRCSYLSAKRV